MKQIFTLLLLNCFIVNGFCQAWDWTRVAGNHEVFSSISIDPQDFFVTGGNKYKDNNGQTLADGLLTKRDRRGNLIWQKQLSGNLLPLLDNWSGAISEATTDNQGNIYTSNTAFDSINHIYVGPQGQLCKFDFNGNLLWSRQFKFMDENGNIKSLSGTINVDDEGNIYVTGVAARFTFSQNSGDVNKKIIYGTDTISIPDPGGYIVVLKTSPSGQLLWLKSFRYHIPHQGAHNTYISTLSIKGNHIVITGNSNLSYLTFDTIGIFPGRGTNFLALLDRNSGVVKWARDISINNQTSACAQSCQPSPGRAIFNNAGKIVFIGGFMRTLQFGGATYDIGLRKGYYLAQFDTSGAEEKIRFFPDDISGNGSPSDQLAYSPHTIVQSGNNYYYHVRRHLYKLDSAYNTIWTSTNNGVAESSHQGMAAAADNRFIGQISHFGGTSTMAGNETIYPPTGATGAYYISRINDAYNIISGYLYYDLNNNGTKDAGEQPLKNSPVIALPGNRFVGLSDSLGFYQCLSDTGTFTYKPAYPPQYHTLTPAAGHTITTNTYNITITNKNFGVAPIPGITDMSVDLVPLSASRPGFTGRLQMIVSNKGTKTETGTATVQLSNQFTYITAYPAPTSVTADSLVFSYGTLAPGASAQYLIEYRINPIVVLGSQLTSLATVYPLIADTFKVNNRDTLLHPITGSFDPNDKAVNLNGNVSIDKKGEALEYTIRFQNTGNDTAFNIRIIDTLSSNLNMASFELVNSTHPVQPEINKDKVLTFYFDNILLVDSVHNEPKSHGAIQFRIKPLSSVQINDSITNRAGIYFDYNAPVMTNTTKTKYVGYPTVNLGSDITTCGGPVILRAANTGNRFVWNTGDTLPDITVAGSGTYWVRVTNQYGFSASDTIQVTIHPLPTVNLGADIAQCSGTATLNAGNPGSSYLWSNGATTQSINAAASSTYSVKVTNANGCFQSDTIQVTIHPVPTVNLGADIAQCGGTVTLTAGNPGSSYLWSNGAVTQNINATASGLYAVKVTNTNGCVASDTIQVTIHPLPAVNLGADIVQCGGTAILNAANSGSSYLWSNGAVTQNITAATSGTYSVRVTNNNGCMGRDTVQVTINPMPTVNLGADAGFCAGSTVVLDAGNAGAAYLWNTGATTRQLAVSLGGQYSVRVTNTAGCAAADTIQLTQRAMPVVQLSLPDTVFASDAPVAALVQPAGGLFTGAGMANGRFDAAAAGQGQHTIRYQYTDAFGCSGQASATVVVLAGFDKVKVYPNPNQGNFTVVAGRALHHGSLTIVTPTGQVVGRFALTAFVQQVRMSLQPGIYYLHFNNNGIAETRRMLVW